MEREGCRVCKCLKIPGIFFEPSDEELLAYYLTEKIEGRPLQCNHLITELQIYHDDLMPWEIIKDDNPYWITSSSDSSNKNKIKKTIYVFTELRKKGSRVIRRSGRGSWTGQNNPVVHNKAGNDIGYNKLLTFNKKKNKIPDDQEHGHWLMHEYSLFGTENYVLCKIIKEVGISAKASHLCPTKAAAPQDFRTKGDAQIMSVVSDKERQSGDVDQFLDEPTTDWDRNGWMEELYQQLNINTSDGQEDINIIGSNQIPGLAIEKEAIAVVNQPSEDWGADLNVNGRNMVLHERYGTAYDHNVTGILHDRRSAGVGVVREVPVVAVMDNPKQGQDILDNSSEETVLAMQELRVAVWGENGPSLDGAGNQNIIIFDDDNTGVHDGQELIMIEAPNGPRIQAINVDDQADNNMEGNEQILDDFWNIGLQGADPALSPTNTAWDGSDVILDFSSPEWSDLWDDGTDEHACSIFEGQPKKRMRYDEEDYEQCPSGKKQRCL